MPDFSLRDLDARDARLALSAARFTEKDCGVALRGASLVVALSGGADSTALLVLFCALREKYGLTLTAAHLDHGLRAESAAEAQAAGRLCAGLGVPFRMKREDVGALARGMHCGVEEAGRRARYAFLEQCRLEAGADRVLTAHHLGDLAEDVLMRLSRGAAWPGLGGMKAVVDEPGRRLLRPLLLIEKKDLVAMLRRLGIAWQEDASNQSRAWKRNRVRHDIMPLFLAENPSFPDAIRRLWLCARRDERDWARRSAGLLVPSEDGLLLPASALEALGESERFRAVTDALDALGGQARFDTLDALDLAWQRRLFPRRFSFAGGVKAELSRRGIFFHRAPGR